jgi:hypothetical protein
LKSYRKWIDQLWAKEVVHQTILDIVNHTELELCFASGNIVLNEQTIIQKKEYNQAR